MVIGAIVCIVCMVCSSMISEATLLAKESDMTVSRAALEKVSVAKQRLKRAWIDLQTALETAGLATSPGFSARLTEDWLLGNEEGLFCDMSAYLEPYCTVYNSTNVKMSGDQFEEDDGDTIETKQQRVDIGYRAPSIQLSSSTFALTSTLPFENTTLPNSELSALYDFHTSRQWLYWYYEWFKDTEPCRWAGVTCQCSGTGQVGSCNVITLALSDMFTPGTFPASLANLRYLQSLRLSSCSFTGSIPTEIGLMTSLTSVSLPNNHFTSTLPTQLALLTKLRSLALNGNYIQGSIPTEMTAMSSLSTLSLYQNFLTSSIPSTAGQWSLITLNVQYNYLSSTIPSYLFGFPRFNKLDASYNVLTGQLPLDIGQVSTMGTLDVSYNLLNGAFPPVCRRKVNLYYLNVNGNDLIGPAPTVNYSNCRNLKTLSLSGNKFTSFTGITTWLANTGVIDLASNNLTSVDWASLGSMPKLFSLSVQDNPWLRSDQPDWNIVKTLERFEADQSLVAGRMESFCTMQVLSVLNIKNMTFTCYPSCISFMLSPAVRNASTRCLGDEDKALCGLVDSSDITRIIPARMPSTALTKESSHPLALASMGLKYTWSVANAVGYTLTFSPRSSLNAASFAISSGSMFDIITTTKSIYIPYSSFSLEIYMVPAYKLGQAWGYYFTLVPVVATQGWSCTPNPAPSNRRMLTAPQESNLQRDMAITTTSLNNYGGDICTWTGVKCTLDMVDTIDLNSLDIGGRIPNGLFTLSTLVYLDLHANAFVGTVPSELSASLSHLDLSFNKLSGPIPSNLGDFTALTTLSLTNNRLTGTIPLSLAKLSSASSLSLSGNLLQGKVSSELCVLGENRVSLDLSGNQLTCYEFCWDSISTKYWNFGAISVCAPTSQPSASPTAKPSRQPSSQPSLQPFASPSQSPASSPTSMPSRAPVRPPTPAPTVISVRLATIVTPTLIGSILVIILAALFMTRERRARIAVWNDLPVHRMLQSSEALFSTSEILATAAIHLSTLSAMDYDKNTVLDLAISRGDDDLILGILQLTLPVDSVTKASVPSSVHGYFWTTIIQRDDMSGVVQRVLDTNVEICNELSTSEDQRGRPAINIASPQCQRVIQLSRYLCKRYELEGQPRHISATCRVHMAIDHQDNLRRVALKFMKNKDQFEREQRIRASGHLDEEFVISVLRGVSSDDDVTLASELTRRGFTEHPHLLVMAAAEKNLSQIILTERVASENWTQIRFIVTVLCRAVQSLHSSGIIHADIKPTNIMRVEASFKLIDLDASSRIGVDFTGVKHSSAYSPPELLYLDREGRARIRSCTVDAASRSPLRADRSVLSDPGYDLLLASGAHDIWSLGVVFYELFSGTKLFLSNFEDNMGEEDLLVLYEFSDEFKQRRLRCISDILARNLVSQMLTKDPLRRPRIDHVLAHPFVSGQRAARMVGEEAQFDVFLSYRVASDSANVQMIYEALTRAGLRVWWDRQCLEPGMSWEEGFCDGLIKSRVFVPILSRGAINNPTSDAMNFCKKTESSPCDNVLLEHTLALELHCRGLVEKIYPIMLGDVTRDVESGAQSFQHYFSTGCHPRVQGEVIVSSVQRKLGEHLDRLCLGSPMMEPMSIKKVLDELTINQGKIVVGSVDLAWEAVVKDMLKMVPRRAWN